jgi:ATP-dependent Clp protease ATP-binding subunit ClpA
MPTATSNGSPLIKNLIDISFQLAINLDQTTITLEHILYASLSYSSVRKYLENQGVSVSLMAEAIKKFIEAQTPRLQNKIASNEPNIMTGQITASVQKVLVSAYSEATKYGREVTFGDIFRKLYNEKESYASYFLEKYGITSKIIDGLDQLTTSDTQSTTALAEFCVNLNEKVKGTTDVLIGREIELFDIAHALSKKKKNNVLVVGEPGVGKSELIEGLARNINAGIVPSTLKDKIIYSLDVGSVLAGCHFRGDFEEKIKNVLAALVNEKNAILFIDEAQQINSGGGSNDSGVAFSAMLKPELSRGNIKVIAATTWDGYTQTFKKDTALMRRFRLLALKEPSKAETILILQGVKNSFNKFHKCRIQDDAIEAAVELSVRYQPDRQLPDKAIDLIDSACARKTVAKDKNKRITKLDIIREIETSTGILVKTTDQNNAADILNIRETLNSKIFHQTHAIDKIAESLIISQAGLRDPSKPIGSFLLTGPSGVGKSYTAKQLASYMNMHLLRYDMSEYQADHAMATLIGAPPGYKGYGDGDAGEGKLINDLMKHPNSVILFDEIEKANPNLYTLLLQMMDEGTISSASGKTADCKNTIIIMSSNVGSREKSKINLGFIPDSNGMSAVTKAINNVFLTEIRGRITAMIEYNSLDDLSYRKIAQTKIAEIAALTDKNLTIIATENLISHVLELNKSNEYGARKISGIIDSLIRYPLSVKLLNGIIPNGATVNLDWVGNNLVIGTAINTFPISIKKPVQEK